jgi:hypothetical protein
MMTYGLCQRCGAYADNWSVKEAQFDVGQINHWKVQLCRSCTASVEQAVLAALRQTARVDTGGGPA